MNKLLTLAVTGLALCAIALPARASIGTTDNVPAATLLLPYFDVDLNNSNGSNTVLTIGNSSSSEVLTHVQLWTDRGVPTLNFDLHLAARAVAEIDLRELFVNGTVPSSTPGAYSAVCTGPLALPRPALTGAEATGLRNAHRGVASSLLSGQCGGAVYSDGHARGYVTIDSVNACTALAPGGSGYFVAFGLGIANNNNVLWGEQAIYNQVTGNAYGDTLVHIEASNTDPQTDGAPGPLITPDYTFYGRRNGGSAADNRESLPAHYIGRYSFLGVIDGTRANVWRDPGAVTPFACASPPPGIPSRSQVAFDHQEEVSITRSAAILGNATQSIDLGNPAQAAVPFALGLVYYDLNLPAPSGALGNFNQGYVSHVLTSTGGSAGQGGAWATEPLNQSAYQLPVTFAECNDGMDNDNDGQIDFPADTSCASAEGLLEAPQCSDGISNDTDGLVDFPADPGCSSRASNTEAPECDDGFDNDADTFIDHPTDPQCTSRSDPFETLNPQCNDGIDNDNDGLIDYNPTPGLGDPNCGFPNDNSEYAGICSDGIDNDMDGFTDFPADRGCSSAADNNETNDVCNDGIDNDADGRTDFPNDPGCFNAQSNNESPQCNNGTDDDGDTFIDFPADVGCAAAYSDNERPQCSDGVDNDGDTLIDFPADPSCSSASGTTENLAQCGDGRDNDNDGITDYPLEPGCESPGDNFEGPDCSALDVYPANAGGGPVDNDLDGTANFPADAGCASATDENELVDSVLRACSDGIDNDGDLLVDYPDDTGCTSANDDVEFLPFEAQGQPTAVPTLSQWGLMIAALAMLLAGGWGLRRRFAGE